MRWALSTVTPATSAPVTLSELKAHLRKDDDDENDLLDALILAATDWAENYTRRAFMAQSMRLTLDYFPTYEIHIPRNPVTAISSIVYIDEGGSELTLSASEYIVDLTEPARITPTYGNTWPTTRGIIGSVKVNFAAGYEAGSPGRDAVPALIKAAIKLLAAHWYEHRVPASEAAMTEGPFFITSMLSRYRLITV